ncbi:hypothetical protein RFM68_06675 [Mesorhizobium sp. MSK_1335]|uniref:Glycosyl hydrolase family 32 N-terminal domain-containing protein n=1 Tax=Mesorhizobium montanum TaxID=3072323 RepID=A0ABU4ZFP3_9HYPH|nr:hypothetical protein [Mesorhizobium sp. MSK_1335]MDX8524183.1 hypothetical protein [Mesorhizobium sp. MSK_1335]
MTRSRFKRTGLVCRPGGSGWERSHCQNPFAQSLGNETYRIHFASRDDSNRSRGGWVDVAATAGGLTPTGRSDGPSLDLGRPGTFDDCGAMPGCLVNHDGRLVLYYTGWSLTRPVPFTFAIGLAESRDGGRHFERVSEAPVLGRNHYDPLLAGAPWVLVEDGSFRMWYVSGLRWQVDPEGKDAPIHYYTVKHATSSDGVIWKTDEHICLPFLEGEHAIARPVVQRTEAGYEMLYCTRRLGETYRVYQATSADGVHWQRERAPLLDTNASGWDSEMVCYASLLRTAEASFLLYNGNGYGRDGVGAAILES